jgi:phenylacetic acid degradation operon negative regulatory protein
MVLSGAGPIPTRALVLGMVRADGTLRAGELYDVADACGLTSEQVRLCLRRLQADGVLTGTGRGRRAVFRTEQAEAGILPDLELVHLAFRQDAGEAPWDGHWHLVALHIPESVRGARDRLREELVLLGGAPLGGGLYVSPHPWDGMITSVAQTLGVAGHLTMIRADRLSHGGVAAPRELVTRLWDLDSVAAGYDEFTATLDGVGDLASAVAADGDDLVGAVRVAMAFTRAIEPDPLLPPELLPPDFPGPAARARLLELLETMPDPGPNPPRLLLGLDPTVAMQRVREATLRQARHQAAGRAGGGRTRPGGGRP